MSPATRDSNALLPTPALRPASPEPAVGTLSWWIPALAAALAVAVYANSLRNDFAFDDLTIVRDNPHVVNLEWTAIWTDNYWPRSNGILPDTLYRPLTLWTYLANQALAPGAAWTFHLVNILLHALVSMLVSILAWRILGNRRIALVAGVLFSVHPLHTEVVANTVGRAELLAALWSLLALLIYLPPAPLAAEQPPLRRAWWHGLLVAACFLAAILSKETPVTLILAIPLLDLWFWLRRPAERPHAWWRGLAGQFFRYYLPLGLALGLYLDLRASACGLLNNTKSIHPIVNSLVLATPLERLITPFTLLAKYLWLTFWPVHLSADYSAPSLLPTANPFHATSFQPPAVAGMMILALALVLALRQRRHIPAFLLLLGLFVTSYVLVSNYLRIGTIFGERLFYWPSVFVLIMVAWAAVAGYQKLLAARPVASHRTLLLGALIVLAVPVGLMSRITWQRNTDWSNNIALAISTARDNPGSSKACCWAGSILVVADRDDYVAFGKSLLDRALELAPNYGIARWEMAKYYGRLHDMGNSAISIAQAVRCDPGSHMSRVVIPALLEEMRMHPPEDYMPVIEAYRCAHPDDETAYLALAYAYHAQLMYDEAASNVRTALDLYKHVKPDGSDQFHEAGAELAAIWFDQGKLKEAADKFRTYVIHMPHSTDAHCTLASMLLKLDAHAYPDALGEADFNITVAGNLDPGNVRPRELRGQLNQLRRELHAEHLSASAGDTKEQNSGVGP
jgi:tetratricopeptide (TPR) repeat protein